jgi:hypothetical protein
MKKQRKGRERPVGRRRLLCGFLTTRSRGRSCRRRVYRKSTVFSCFEESVKKRVAIDEFGGCNKVVSTTLSFFLLTQEPKCRNLCEGTPANEKHQSHWIATTDCGFEEKKV